MNNKEALDLALMTLEHDNLKVGNIYVNYDIQKALIKLVKKELEKEEMMKRVMDGIPDMPVKVQDKRSFEEFAQSFAQSAQVNGIPDAYTPAKGGLLPKREPSGSWTSWDNTMCNPLADARMQTQSAWADGYASAKAEWVGLTTDEVFELASTKLPLGLFAGLIERKLREKNGA